MKKFLSLLLALTLVLSLVVVPARAAGGDTPNAVGSINITASKQKVVQGDKVTFTASNPTITYNSTNYSGSNVHVTYKWDNNSEETDSTYEVTAATTNITAHLTAVLTYTIPAATAGGEDTTIQVTIDKDSSPVTVITKQQKANEDFAKALSFTYNDRPCTKNENGSITAYSFSDKESANWDATATGYTIGKNGINSSTPGKLTVTATPNPTIEGINSVTAMVDYTVIPASVAVTPASSTILSGGVVDLTAEAKGFTDAKYAWYTVADGKPDTPVNRANSDTLGVKLTNDTDKDVTYKYKCKVTNGAGENAPTVESNTVTITVKPAGQFQLLVTAEQDGLLVDNSNIVLTNSTKKVEFGSTLYDHSGKKPAIVTNGVTYGYDVSGTTTAFDTTLGKNRDTLTVALKSGRSGSITVTPYATYMGLTVYGTPKTYTISSNNLSATLPPAWRTALPSRSTPRAAIATRMQTSRSSPRKSFVTRSPMV